MAFTLNEGMADEIKEIRDDLKDYQSGNDVDCLLDRTGVEFPKDLHIGLFGKTGCGKTSLINSMKFAVSGRRVRQAKQLQTASTEHPGGHTLHRFRAKLVDHIYVIDNRGLDDLTFEQTLDELEAQIDGKRGYNDTVIWRNSEGGDKDVVQREIPIACVVYVFSAKHSIIQSITGLSKVVSLLHKKQGRYPLAVITHVDCVVRERVDELKSALQGTGISEIFEVANITKDRTTLDIPYQHSLLSVLDRCMADGDAAVVFKHNQEGENMAKKERNEELDRQFQQLMNQESDLKDLDQKVPNDNFSEHAADLVKGVAITVGAVAAGAGAVSAAAVPAAAAVAVTPGLLILKKDCSDVESIPEFLADYMGVVTSSAATGATIGCIGGPVGAGVGAGIGAVVGVATYLTKQHIDLAKDKKK